MGIDDNIVHASDKFNAAPLPMFILRRKSSQALLNIYSREVQTHVV
jgi:hypothetical protein